MVFWFKDNGFRLTSSLLNCLKWRTGAITMEGHRKRWQTRWIFIVWENLPHNLQFPIPLNGIVFFRYNRAELSWFWLCCFTLFILNEEDVECYFLPSNSRYQNAHADMKQPWISHVTLFNRTAGTKEKVNEESGVCHSEGLIEKLVSPKTEVVSMKTYINS